MYLIIDTETSGICRHDLPHDDPIQPRVLSLAMLTLDDQLDEINSFYSLIHPGTQIFIHPKATEANGITWDEVEKYGIPISTALKVFDFFCNMSDLIIAHNVKFDTKMMDIEIALSELPNKAYDWKSQSFCTMLSMTNICKLVGTKGNKWPKLIEAFNYCYPDRANSFREHNALDDVRACADIFRWYHKRQVKLEICHEAIQNA